MLPNGPYMYTIPTFYACSRCCSAKSSHPSELGRELYRYVLLQHCCSSRPMLIGEGSARLHLQGHANYLRHCTLPARAHERLSSKTTGSGFQPVAGPTSSVGASASLLFCSTCVTSRKQDGSHSRQEAGQGGRQEEGPVLRHRLQQVRIGNDVV